MAVSTKSKMGDAGWFYHAPSKPSHNEAVVAPPPSQIPGMSGSAQEAYEPEESTKMWFRDTDSDYIRLAKQGGRPDLLRFRSPKPQSEEAQGYPRCDWFYHQDNQDEDQPAEKYEFMLPNYMVHEDRSNRWRETDSSPGHRHRAPYAHSKDQVYTGEESRPTDKTVKLPEIRPAGYGVRAEKQQGRTVKHAPIERPEAIRPKAELDAGSQKYEPWHRQKEEESQIAMGKLMSHGYVSEWEDSRNSWQKKQTAAQHKSDDRYGRRGPDKLQTEYQEKMKTSPTKDQATAGVSSRNGSEKGKRSDRNMVQSDEKELFKLSKFKKVPARTDCHRQGSGASNMQHHNPILHDPDYQYQAGDSG